ncbi:DUF536 domain-containing protein [Weissella paramesenteroides]|uniref:DUF536 domain-containing protein n=1 Tax=Weissella paramesenteroides TaxID=1249 RepID=UPI003CC5F2DB
MTKTIRELANELNVSKQTIQYHYQRLSSKDQQKDTNGRNVINQHTEEIIRNKVTKPLSTNNTTNTDKDNKETKDDSTALILSLEAQIEDLKSERDKQFSTKDKQIASKDRQIDSLTKLLDQSQQLQLMAEKKIKELQKIEQPKTEDTVTEPTNSNNQNETTEAPKKWWQFWN